MKSISIFILLFFLGLSGLYSQDSLPRRNERRELPVNPRAFSWDKVSIGGDFGISNRYVNISPMAGYMVSERLMAGAGATYLSYGGQYYTQWITIYGGRIFGRYYVFPFAFVHGELEELNGPWDPYSIDPFWINTTLIGGGYRQRIAGTFYIDSMILFNVNDNIYSPYQNPIFRMGMNIGL